MRANSVGFAAALLLIFGASPQAQRTAPPAAVPQAATSNDTARNAANGKFELTVDTIMKGSDLVGYPPTGLRWSADSQKLYFEWRKPGEDKASTYVVSRDGGAPQKLSENETKNIPPAAGARWDKAHRRVLFVDDGDIVMVDAISGKRVQIT